MLLITKIIITLLCINAARKKNACSHSDRNIWLQSLTVTTSESIYKGNFVILEIKQKVICMVDVHMVTC